MATKKFKFKNPNTGLTVEYADTPYFRKMVARIQKKYDNLSDERKNKIKERIAARNKRQSDTSKKQREVTEGRASGMSMTEIRAKRMNISASELNKRQLATLLNMAAGMSTFLPAGAAIKAGQLVYKGMKGAKAAKALRAAANANKAKTTKLAKPSQTSPATRGSNRPRKNEVIEGKAVEKPSKPVRPTKPTDKKPGTSVAKRPRTDVKKPGTGVMEIRRAGTGPRTMKRVQGSDKPTPKTRVKGPDKAKSNKTLRNLLIAAGAAGTVGGAAYLSGRKGKDATATVPSKPTPKPKSVTKPTPKPKPPAKKGPATGTPPLGGPSDGTKKKKKPTPKPGNRASNRTSFNAGKGVGFGPKGNIFPSNAAERAALMKMYGGTGSKAAKAAKAGTQGDLVAGKAAYEKAKRERLRGKK